MGKMAGIGCLVALVAGVVLLGLVGVGMYNNLVGLGQGVDRAWSQVENQYQRRSDLIPNLVSTVQGAANFEKSTLEAVTQARASVGQLKVDLNDPASMQRFEQAQTALSGALSRLLAVAEAYPDLKASQNFRDLQAQLEGTENRIAVARKDYNEAAQGYNTARLRFPTVLVANLMGFREKAYFRAQAGAEQAPKVDFNFGASPQPTR
jgi:LemA protein